MRYSELFHVTPTQLEEFGVLNANVNEDSNLHRDPSLVKNCSIPEFTNSYQKFLDYFSVILLLAKSANVNNRTFREMVFRLKFKEIANTGLGYSKNNKSGNAIGAKYDNLYLGGEFFVIYSKGMSGTWYKNCSKCKI